MVNTILSIDVDALEDEDLRDVTSKIIKQEQEKVLAQYKEQSEVLLDGYAASLVIATDSAWFETSIDIAELLDEMVKQSNPMTNGSPFNLLERIEELGELHIGDRFKNKRGLLETIKSITEVPFIKTLIASNPILTTVNSVISTVSGYIGNGIGDFDAEKVSKFNARLGQLVEYYEKLAVINSNYAAQVNGVKVRFEQFKPKLELSHRKLVANLMPGDFNSESDVLEYDPANRDSNYNNEIASVVITDDIDVIQKRLFGNNSNSKKFREAVELAKTALVLAAESKVIKQDLEFATKYTKDEFDKLSNVTSESAELATMLSVKETQTILDEKYHALFVDGDPSKELHILQPMLS